MRKGEKRKIDAHTHAYTPVTSPKLMHTCTFRMPKKAVLPILISHGQIGHKLASIILSRKERNKWVRCVLIGLVAACICTNAYTDEMEIRASVYTLTLVIAFMCARACVNI